MPSLALCNSAAAPYWPISISAGHSVIARFVQRTGTFLVCAGRGSNYYDKVLPFGLRSAPFIFNEVAEAFQWICAHHLSIEDMLHLLNDFLVLGPPKSVLCEQRITLALQMCHYLGIPIADEKTTWPSTELIFLGIILDTDKFESRLPDDKREDLLRLLEDMIDRKH